MSVNQPGDVAYGFSQALIGVPSKPIIAQRNPTVNDRAQIGTMWINQAFNEVYILTSVVDNIATWVQADSSSAFNQVDADVGSAVPNLGILNAFGGDNINTAASGNTLTINLNDNVDLPATNSAGTQGIYQIGGANFLFGYGPTNTFVGGNAGNTTLTVLTSVRNVGVGNNAINSLTTGANNTAVGVDSLTTLSTGINNVAVGYLSLTALTSGESNTALGNQSLQNLVTGEDNIAIGFAAGSAYNGAQTSNILISNPGAIGDSNTIRIGDQGTGPGQQDTCYIAGIYNTPVGVAQQVMFVDNQGGVGSYPGNDGEVIIGATGASPIWNTLTAGDLIDIDNGPNSITISCLVAQAIESVIGDNGGTASGIQISVTGGNNIFTAGDNGNNLNISVSGTTNHALQVGNAANALTSLAVATNGQLPIGSTGANPVISTLTAGSNVTITNGAGSITINAAGSGVVTIDGDAGSATGDPITFDANTNCGSTVLFDAAGSTVSLKVTDAALNNTIIGLSSGNGTITGTNNVGLGRQVLLALSSGIRNCGVGNGNLLLCSTGSWNTAVGDSSLFTLGAGTFNTAVGALSLTLLTDGTHNTALGETAGALYASTESSNIVIGNTGVVADSNVIRIGTQGSGTAEQDSCFIAGIGGVTPGGTPEFVIIDPATGELGSTASGGSGVTTIDGDSGSATGATITFDGLTNSGSSVLFDATASTVSLNIGDTVLNNCIVGKGSGNGTLTGGSNVALGVQALPALTNGTDNIAIGYLALNTAQDCVWNVAVGTNALAANTTGNGTNIAIGYFSLASLVDGVGNIAIGANAGSFYNGTEGENICIANVGVTGESQVIRIGTLGSQDLCFIQGIGGVTPGGTPEFVVIDPATGQLGSQAGGGAGVSAIDGDSGTATGATITFDASTNCGSTVEFTASASTVELSVTSILSNTMIGSNAGNGAISGTANLGLGQSALLGLTSGVNNCGIGNGSLTTCSSGDANVAVGQGSLFTLGTGNSNTSIGTTALNFITSGSNNIGIGQLAGTSYTSTESSNIVIGNSGTIADANTIRIGTQGAGAGQQNKAFMAGIAGVTVASSAAMLINTSTGQMGTVVSSRRYKENISELENDSQGILELRPVKFNYKNDTSREVHYGLIAEEVEGVFPDLVIYNKDRDPETVRYHELPALLISEIQRQHAIIADLSRRLERLETRGSYESKA